MRRPARPRGAERPGATTAKPAERPPSIPRATIRWRAEQLHGPRSALDGLRPVSPALQRRGPNRPAGRVPAPRTRRPPRRPRVGASEALEGSPPCHDRRDGDPRSPRSGCAYPRPPARCAALAGRGRSGRRSLMAAAATVWPLPPVRPPAPTRRARAPGNGEVMPAASKAGSCRSERPVSRRTFSVVEAISGCTASAPRDLGGDPVASIAPGQSVRSRASVRETARGNRL